MARIRSIHPSLFTDEAYMGLSFEARELLKGIWCEADDQGVFEWKPLTLKARIMPADNVDAGGILSELEGAGFVTAFTVEGKQYGAVRNFRKFQRPKKPNASHPLPDEFRNYVGLPRDGSEPVPNSGGNGGGKSPQMEDGGGSNNEKETRPRVPLHEQHDHDGPPPAKDQTEAGSIVKHFHAERKRLWPTDPSMPEPPMTSRTTAEGWLAEGIPRDVIAYTMTRVLERHATTGRSPPPTLRFFVNSMADAKANHQNAAAPLPQGTANGKRPDHQNTADAAAARRRAALERHGLGGLESGDAGSDHEGPTLDGTGRLVA